LREKEENARQLLQVKKCNRTRSQFARFSDKQNCFPVSLLPAALDPSPQSTALFESCNYYFLFKKKKGLRACEPMIASNGCLLHVTPKAPG